MRMIAILALLLLAFPTPASEAVSLLESGAKRDFNLEENSRRATHILVVDACGKILDVWKGTARVGDYISLDTVLNPTFRKLGDTRQSRFNWLNDPHAYSSYMLSRRDRMILFLVQAPTPNPLDLRNSKIFELEIGYRFYEPRFSNPDIENERGILAFERVARLVGFQRGFQVSSIAPDGWCGKCPIPRTPLLWSACSMAFVDDIGYVHAQGWGTISNYRHRQWDKIILMWERIGTEDDVQRKVWDANNPRLLLD